MTSSGRDGRSGGGRGRKGAEPALPGVTRARPRSSRLKGAARGKCAERACVVVRARRGGTGVWQCAHACRYLHPRAWVHAHGELQV